MTEALYIWCLMHDIHPSQPPILYEPDGYWPYFICPGDEDRLGLVTFTGLTFPG